jgi:NAD(P)-dependent dehydrogenase (short-subunit alcohol dehydrogenase family)
MKTVLITGCSSGFGLETARDFLDRGNWNVIATMRTPDATLLPASDQLSIVPLDVTDPSSIHDAVAAAGSVDVLINNAGIGWLNALEGTPTETVRQIFETNTFGTMAMTQALLPQFRERRSGVIVNVSSSTTLKPLRLLSVYTASKAAVNAFSECLALELEPFGIRVRIVLPGAAPGTSFGSNARARMAAGFPKPYAEMAASVFAAHNSDRPITHAQDVSGAIWRAVVDPTCPMRIAAGADAVALM